MITQQDITKLKKSFATKKEIILLWTEIKEMRADNDDQRDVLAQTFTDIINRLQAIEDGQTKILELLVSHQQRLTTLESKILLS